ncbi:MAG TPA: hypothetical protein PKD17_14950 [Cellvibrionaceae bacterium]|nr:hypothetical protein [Cellvibrionaceae bacterium]HMW73123.1 hypothetical protein [Cellvibrionaceae bacterium]HNG59800.1 hypothetical protein [Cellvibrionaceae bacterium]
MHLKSVTLILFTALGFISAKTRADTVFAVFRVQVFDRDHQVLADSTDFTQFAVFNQVWASK